jgi:hypothetical protein
MFAAKRGEKPRWRREAVLCPCECATGFHRVCSYRGVFASIDFPISDEELREGGVAGASEGRSSALLIEARSAFHGSAIAARLRFFVYRGTTPKYVCNFVSFLVIHC